MDPLQEKLSPLRAMIDALDTQLLEVLSARARVAQQVGEVKKEFSAPVFRPERELQVIQRLQRENAGPLLDEGIAAIWREIMSACRALEKTLIVAFLGPVGTFSEQAALSHFGHGVDHLPCPSIDDVFRAVEAGSADFGVVPVENSSEGAVSRTLDLLLQTQLMISGEIALPVHHNLLTRSGTLDGVTRVCAHAQALAQCQGWLATHHPGLGRQAVASNAEAARMAAEDPAVAAIASEGAALSWALQAVQRNIQDDPHNRTRFFVIGAARCAPSGRDRTSLILSVPNEAGAVYRLLEPLARHGVSMSRLESRPARSGGWEYYFHIDVEGHQQDAPVAAALEELRRNAAFIKILGSYPARSNI